MEINPAQVNDLHKKFEELNEEVSAALRVQQDAIAASASSSGSSSNMLSAKRDTLRLAKKTVDWRGDVAALAKHIDLQLQHSRALRAHHAESLLSTTASSQKQQEETESSRLRCLRSDLRLLQDFRVGYMRVCGEKDPELLSTVAEETKQLKAFMEKSAKREKMGGKKEQMPLVLDLFEMRREIMSRISEDLLKEKKQLDVEVGNPEALTTGSAGDVGGTPAEKDALASWDTQLYTLMDLQKEMRERLANKARNSVSVAVSPTKQDKKGELGASAEDSRAVMPGKSNQGPQFVMQIDEMHFSMQKLKREVADLKSSNAKLLLSNSQLEDDLTQLQAKFEEEKRTHLNGRKWFLPKIQKLEEVVLTTGKAFEEVKLSVELMTNMYKHLSHTLSAQQELEDEAKRERDRMAKLLSAEIKKIAALTKENERKDQLLTVAMAARYEMIQLANRQEALAKQAREECAYQEARAKQAEDDITAHKLQLKDAYARLEATNTALTSAKTSIEQLQGEVQASARITAAKEQELHAAFEKQKATMQQRLDKAKKEQMEAMSEALNLEGRLRKVQEKLNQHTTGGST